MSEVDGTCEYVLNPDDTETWGGEEGEECYIRVDMLNEDGVWTCPHDAEEGKDRCIFHQPVDEKSDEEVVDAFLDKVDEATPADDPEARQRKLEFIGAKFGDFELGEGSPDVLTEEAQIMMSYLQVDGRFEWSVDVSDITFRGATFVDDVVFESTELGGEASFYGADFGREAIFDYVEFGGYSSFRSVRFGEQASFLEVEFGGKADFESAKFGSEAIFGYAEFRGKANFYEAEFGTEANFYEADFGGESRFLGSEFGGEAKFGEVRFGGRALFSGSKFAGKAYIRSVVFGKEADFKRTKFRETADFRRTKFEGETNIYKAKFGEQALFSSAEFVMGAYLGGEFEGEADFRSTEFGGGAYFGESVDFRGKADFKSVVFGKEADFRRTEFEGEVNFLKAEFKKVANFGSAEFVDMGSFRQAKFNGGANFEGANMTDADFEEAHLENADFDGADLSGANLERAKLSNADLFGADLSGARLYGARIGDVKINTETVFDRHGEYRCVYDPNSEYEYDPNDDEDEKVDRIRKAMGAYHVLEQLTRANTLPDEQSKFFARRQDMRRAQLRRDEEFPRFRYLVRGSTERYLPARREFLTGYRVFRRYDSVFRPRVPARWVVTERIDRGYHVRKYRRIALAAVAEFLPQYTPLSNRKRSA